MNGFKVYLKIVGAVFAMHSWLYNLLLMANFVIWALVFKQEHYHAHHGVLFSCMIASLVGGISGIPTTWLGFRELRDEKRWDVFIDKTGKTFREIE